MLFRSETWLTAEQCVELGLADRLADTDADMSGASTILQKMNAGMEQHLRYQKSLAAQLRDLAAAPSVPAPNKDPQGGGSPEKINKVLGLFS